MPKREKSTHSRVYKLPGVHQKVIDKFAVGHTTSKGKTKQVCGTAAIVLKKRG